MKNKFWYGISATVILLSVTSLLTDVSSEIIRAVLPLFLTALGAGGVAVGLIGGMSDTFASLFKVFSGYLSDKTGKRKPYIFSGYSMSSIAKLFISLSTSWIHVLIFQPIERIGKGVRDPPRDALLAETTPKAIHGKIFGFHRLLDTAGAFFGAALAFLFLWLLGLELRTIILIAAVVAFIALIPLMFIKEKKKKAEKISLKISLKTLPKNFRIFIFIVALFSLADFSYMFFVLKAAEAFPYSKVIPVLMYVLFNFVYAVFALPSGMLSDKIGRKNTLVIGYLLFSATTLGFAFLQPSIFVYILLFATYGLSYAFIVGTERAFASDLVEKRFGTALGTFHTILGLAALPASLIAGILWQYVSPAATFLFATLVADIAAILFILNKKLKI